MLLNIEGAVTNAEVVEIYSIGRSALKRQLQSMTSVDAAEDLVDDIVELINQVRRRVARW
jgi:hypothetical protein